MEYRFRIDRAFERTTKGRRDGDLRFQPFGFGKADHLPILLNALLYGLALIFLTECVARHDHAADFVNPALVALSRRQSAENATLVQTQADIGNIIAVGQAGNHVFGIGHLWHAPRMDKARHFNPAHPCIQHMIDQAELVRRRNNFGFILQTVAWTDFQNIYKARGFLCHIMRKQSCSSFV